MIKIDIYTDGSCLGNPGVGGYACVMQAKNKKKYCSGYSAKPNETNNRMELKALICALNWCNNVQKEPCDITFYTDSQTLIYCSEHSDYSLLAPERKNHDLWAEFITERDKGKHKISFVKVKGHSDCELNAEADRLAKQMAIKARHVWFEGVKHV